MRLKKNPFCVICAICVRLNKCIEVSLLLTAFDGFICEQITVMKESGKKIYYELNPGFHFLMVFDF